MKKWLIVMIALLLVFPYQAIGHAEWDVYFEDLPKENAHYSNIYYLADKGIIKGYPTDDGYPWIFAFKPANDVTKRQVAAMLVRALGLSGTAPDPGFVDVTKKDSAYNDIALAMQKGLFKKSTHFKPATSITREEMAYALVRAFHLKGQSKLTFSDVPKTHAAYSDVQALAANFITTGTNGKFNPKANLTRAQFASFLARAILPDARPTDALTFGFVPEAEGKTYKYRLYHGGGYEELVYDHVRFASYPGFNRTLLLTKSDDIYTEMGYFENSQAVQFDVPLDGYSRLFVLEYPLQTGKTFYFNDASDDNPQSPVSHKVTIYTINGIHKIEDTVYTNVTIASDRFQYQYDDAVMDIERIFYISRDYGIIAVEMTDSMLELERID